MQSARKKAVLVFTDSDNRGVLNEADNILLVIPSSVMVGNAISTVIQFTDFN